MGSSQGGHTGLVCHPPAFLSQDQHLHSWLTKRSIQWQELFAIVAAAHTWGHRLAGCRIRFHCDNLAVVHTWNGQSSRDTAIMGLLRELFYVAACNNFTVQLVHIPGKHNSLADALSRDMLSRFFTLAPQADPLLTAIMPAVLANL